MLITANYYVINKMTDGRAKITQPEKGVFLIQFKPEHCLTLPRSVLRRSEFLA